ncbi:MAG: hypothetical protein ACREFZ_00250 [Acetobacteraceae bacterium]
MQRASILALLLALAMATTIPARAEPAPAPPSWPHTITVSGSRATIYQPQAISWPGRKNLTARVAIELAPTGAAQPVLGTVELSFATTVAGDWIELSQPELVSSHFPALDTARAVAVEAKMRAALPNLRLPRIALANLLVSLGHKPPVTNVALDNNPPVVFVSDKPASLVVFDGEPTLAPLGTSELSFAVNTNWSIFVYRGTWFLLNNGLWLAAPAATGPYHPVTTLPAAFNAIPNDSSFAAVRKYIPPRRPGPSAAVPHIFVSMKPAAIVVTSGPPQFVPVAGTGLQAVKNTASTLFFDPSLGRFYLLLSGRWFAASALSGPWTFASNDLPADFALIPPGSPEAGVLASVPGTTAAEQAVLQASIPHTATLTRASARFSVSYYGPPRFQPIPGTSLFYAVNTNAYVLKVSGRYYACSDGAWFVGASTTGPWTLADAIPPAIATIPPASPLYPLTYVQVYATSPSTITYGYTAGYMMGFVTAGVLIYGTGYYYPPVVLPGRMPIYYPYPYTYAGNVWYNSATGAWARGGSVYGPYYGASAGRAYNPATGAWAQGAAIYGPYGGAGAWSAYNSSTGAYAHGSAVWGSGTANANYYNPRTGVSASTNQNVDPYQRWGSSTISGPNQTVHTQSGSNARGSAGAFSSSTGAEGAGYHGVNGNSGGAIKGSGGNVYAGRDGNVYQHTDSGWSKWSNGGWQTVQPSAGSSGRLGQPQASGKLGAGSSGSTLAGRNWQQLQQDRLGRTAGEASGGSLAGRNRQQFQQSEAGHAGSAAAGRFGSFRGRR